MFYLIVGSCICCLNVSYGFMRTQYKCNAVYQIADANCDTNWMTVEWSELTSTYNLSIVIKWVSCRACQKSRTNNAMVLASGYNLLFAYKNIERHTADTIFSWPNPKQWVKVHTSDLIMIIRQSIYIISIITREMGKLKTNSPTYCIMDNGENMLNLTHTLDKIYLTGIL